MSTKITSLDAILRERAEKQFKSEARDSFKTLVKFAKDNGAHPSNVGVDLLPILICVLGETAAHAMLDAVTTTKLHVNGDVLLRAIEEAVVAHGNDRVGNREVTAFMARVDTLGEEIEELRSGVDS